MADQQHLTILLQGINIWNKWRIDNPDIKPDLSKVSLYNHNVYEFVVRGPGITIVRDKAFFKEVDFSDTNLSGAYLHNVVFNGSNFRDASPEGAILTEAHLNKCVLLNANLTNAKLQNSYLVDSNLQGSIFYQAKLSYANLSNSNAFETNFESADLYGVKFDTVKLWNNNFKNASLPTANLSGKQLVGSNFESATLNAVKFEHSNLRNCNFRKAHLGNSQMKGANLTKACFEEAILNNSDMSNTVLIETNFKNAEIVNTKIFGISAWDVNLENTKQPGLVITRSDQLTVTVDNLEVAQFIYLLLYNEKISSVIDTISSKVVLILGRFTVERKIVLDAIKKEIRKYDYIPVIFDFDKPANRDTIETVSTLAHIARFVIADLTDAKSVLQELQRIVPNLPSVPIMPILKNTDYEPGMFDHLRQFRHVLEVHRYKSVDDLISDLSYYVVQAAQKAYEELIYE